MRRFVYVSIARGKTRFLVLLSLLASMQPTLTEQVTAKFGDRHAIYPSLLSLEGKDEKNASVPRVAFQGVFGVSFLQ